MQNPKSVEDQIADCRRFIAEQPWGKHAEIVIFSDNARTGKIVQRRPGYNGLIEALKKREIGILVAEGLDRISRDMGNSSHVYKMSEFYGADIYSLEDGKVTSIHVGIRSIMNDMYTDKMKSQVKRSQRNRALEGKMTGLAYGYKIKIRNEREATGERIIDENKALIIREIFTMYADGHSLSSIAQILNSRGIPSPRGGQWQKTALIGSIKRHEGLLCNQLYRGRIIWNMKSKHINPETGGKNYFVNPQSEWVIHDDENLRIISEELWARCDLRKFARSPQERKKDKVHIFNPYRDLVFCAQCGAKKILADRKRFVCQGWKAKRTCTNARGTQEHVILQHLEHTLQRAISRVTSKELKQEIENTLLVNQQSKSRLIKDLNKLEARIEKLSTMLDQKGISLDSVTNKLQAMQHERSSLVAQINQALDTPPFNVKTQFENVIDELCKELARPQVNDKYRVLLFLFVDKILLSPRKDKSIGENVDVVMRKDVWPKLYQFLANK